MSIIGRTGRRTGQRVKTVVISPTTVTISDPVSQDPTPTGLTGQPMGLLLSLTYAS